MPSAKPRAEAAPAKLSVKPVTATTWPDLETLFEGRGGPSYCWCMAWREMPERSSADNAARKKALHERVRRRVPIGLVGYSRASPSPGVRSRRARPS